MIVRGIVTEKEKERIKKASTQHQLIHGRSGELRIWTEETPDEKALWVELDVNEEMMDYLKRTGFFDDADTQHI